MPVATLEAARKNKSGELSELLTPENVNATDGRSWTALHKACWAGNATCVAEILKHGGADLELRTNRSGGGDTALEMAVWNGLGCNSGSISGGAHDYVGCVILLVTAGAIMTEGAWKHLATEFQSEKHQATADMMIGAWACIARDDADFTVGNAPTPPPASPTPPTPQTEMTTSTAGGPSDEAELPPEITCPITQEVMRDPVATVDGQTYERSAIEHWLRDHNTSPLTGEVLAMKMLIPNHTVRGLSRKWLEEHPECKDGEGGAPRGEEVKGPTMVRGNDEWPSLS